MTFLRRSVLAVLLVAVGAISIGASPASAQERTGDDNIAVAVNTEDGASVFRLAFSIRMAHDDVVDQTNTAIALASCTDCQTVALAFQVVLVRGDVDVATPENLALAYNDQCVECVTYASATQIVLGFDGPLRFTPEGRQRLNELDRALRDLEERAAELTLAQLNAEVQAAKQELVSILAEEIVEVDQGRADDPTTTSSSSSTTDPDATTTTTEGDDETTTSTTADEATTTSTTEAEVSTTTTTSTPESTTTTTAA